MKFSKERLAEIFAESEHLLKAYHLPTWEELPTIDLYMDQVILLLNEYLSIFRMVSPEEKMITPTMINNYVKQKIVPAPVKKKYSKTHLAYLIILCILKQTLPIPMISNIVPPDLTESEIKAVYQSFVKNHATAFNYVTEQITKVSNPILTGTETDEDKMNDLVFQVANSANIFKLLTGWITHVPSETSEKQ